MRIPKRVNIELCNACCYNCTICSDTHEREVSNINGNLFADLLYNLKDDLLIEGVDKLPELRLFVSGEPTMHPYFPELVRQALSMDFNVLVHTNGLPWSIKISNYLSKLSQNSLKRLKVVFSINGGDRYSYAEIHGKDKYHSVINNLWYFISSLESEKKNVNVSVQCVVPGYDRKQPIPLRDCIQSKQYMDNIIVNVRSPHNWAESDSVGGAESKNYGRCDFIDGDLIVYSDGQVGICCALLNQEKTFGHIEDDFNKSILEAFRCDERTKYIEAYMNRTPLGPCSICERRLK